jgi:hypothetical protein
VYESLYYFNGKQGYKSYSCACREMSAQLLETRKNWDGQAYCAIWGIGPYYMIIEEQLRKKVGNGFIVFRLS